MQGTLSEGTARAAQLAPSAVTASAVGGSATRGVVGRVSPTTSGSSSRVLVISRVMPRSAYDAELASNTALLSKAAAGAAKAVGKAKKQKQAELGTSGRMH